MIIGAKYKICKRLGSGVFDKCQTQKFVLSEARSTKAKTRTKRRGGMSEYGAELIEKQKARFMYGLSERQFGKYVRNAVEKKGSDSIGALIGSLESRLDNVIYRLGFAKTRRQARQLVSHGHITIAGRKVTIPSYAVAAGDKIGIREGSKARTFFVGLGERLGESAAPSWLAVDAKKLEGSVIKMPEALTGELVFDPKIIIQFYSR